MLHKESIFVDGGCSKVEFDGEYLTVCFQVLLENAVVFYSCIFVDFKSVQNKICNYAVAFVF